MSDVTQILPQIESGDPGAAERLLPAVYDELRKLAAAKLAHEKTWQTLQATALVHEAYLRLVDQNSPQQWDSARHFFAAAAEAMRRILIERARQKQSLKRGGDRERIELAAVEPAISPMACDDILGLDEALHKLEQKDPRKAKLVKLRCPFRNGARAWNWALRGVCSRLVIAGSELRGGNVRFRGDRYPTLEPAG